MRQSSCRVVTTPAVLFRSVNRTGLAPIHTYIIAETQSFPILLISQTCWFVCSLIRYTHTQAHAHARTSEDLRPINWHNFLYRYSRIAELGRISRGTNVATNQGFAHGYPRFSVLKLNITETKQDYLVTFCKAGHLTQTYPM